MTMRAILHNLLGMFFVLALVGAGTTLIFAMLAVPTGNATVSLNGLEVPWPFDFVLLVTTMVAMIAGSWVGLTWLSRQEGRRRQGFDVESRKSGRE